MTRAEQLKEALNGVEGIAKVDTDRNAANIEAVIVFKVGNYIRTHILCDEEHGGWEVMDNMAAEEWQEVMLESATDVPDNAGEILCAAVEKANDEIAKLWD